MTIRRGWAVGAVLASMVVLAGCSSGSSSSATTSAATTSSVMTSSAVSSAAGGSGATTTVGGDATEFDAQTVTWFDTMCTGMEPLADLQQSASSLTTTAQLGSAMSTIGTSMTETASKLAALPAPTFEGGDTVAQTVQTGLASFGQTFTDFSKRAAELKDGDTAALQQFQSDLAAEVSKSPIANLDATADVQAAIKQIPSCRPLFGSS